MSNLKLLFVFCMMSAFPVLSAKAVDIQFSDASYHYDAATGVITNLTFTIKSGSMGTPGFDVDINLMHEPDMAAKWIDGQTGMGGVGGGSSRTFTFPKIDLNGVSGLSSGTYRLAVYIPQFQSEVYFPFAPNDEISFTSTSTGISEASFSQMMLYPNPVISSLKISLGTEQRQSGSLEIYNMTGSLVQVQQIATGSGEISINCSQLPKGIYMCRLNMGNALMEKQFIKL